MRGRVNRLPSAKRADLCLSPHERKGLKVPQTRLEGMDANLDVRFVV